MNKTRFEAFSDGVFAIIITIMVLEIKVPHEPTMEELKKLLPVFCSYVVSFVFVAIYWVNHHHLIHCIKKVDTGILWANVGLLFTLSLIPFCTGWVSESNFASLPTRIYCIDMMSCGFAAWLLQVAIVRGLPKDNPIFEVIKQNLYKNLISFAAFIIAVFISFWNSSIAFAIIALISVMWMIPSKRMEKILNEETVS